MSNMTELFIHPTASLDQPLRALQNCRRSIKAPNGKTILPKIGFIGAYTSIGCSAIIGEKVVIDDYCKVEVAAKIGEGSILIYRATLGGYAEVGRSCVIGGFIPEHTKIGDNSRILGTLTHLHDDPSLSWDFHSVPEKAPIIGSNVFIGLNATVIGGVTIENNVYVCAGAVVKTDVPSMHIVSRGGNIYHYTEWKGKLRDSNFFKSGN